ncbi:MAG: ADP-forming succinate--CoA ligase subunit beta [Granulosicoccaceae bacterium]
MLITMDIHEYQSKELLAGFGVYVPKGGLAYSPEQAAYRAREIGGTGWVVKAQVHSGGRAKAGGIKVCKDEEAVYNMADSLFGTRLQTDQAGDKGKVVYRVYVESLVPIQQEFYLGFVLDRKTERIMVVASKAGGIDIEDIAAQQPESIIRCAVEPAVGMQAFQAKEVAFKLGIDPAHINSAVATIMASYRAFDELDATMVEINPLAVSEDGSLYAVDAKMTFDDNALYRHPDIAELRDKSQEDPSQTRAMDRGLSYVGYDGDIACIVNGAGLAMATIEMLRHFGGEPSCFMDIGGGASADKVAKAIRLARRNPNIKALLINVFAGINHCDRIAEGIVQAVELDPLDMPLIVRLAGTRVAEGKKILSKSGLPIVRGDSLKEVAQRAVTAASRFKPIEKKSS